MAMPAKKLSFYSCLIAGVVLTAWWERGAVPPGLHRDTLQA